MNPPIRNDPQVRCVACLRNQRGRASSIVAFAGWSVRVRFDRFTLDTDRRQLIRDTENVHLSPKAFDLLALLVRHRPKALAKTELLAQIWPSTFIADGSLAVVVAEIRAALGDVPRRSRFVRTVHRFGYAFCGDIEGMATSSTRPGADAAPTFRLLWDTEEAFLEQGATILGRGSDVGVRLDAQGVSRHHAQIVVSGKTATLEDLSSKNGTYVRGSRIASAVPLVDGAVFFLGPIEVRVRVTSPRPNADETVTVSDIARSASDT